MTPLDIVGWGAYRPRASCPSTAFDAALGRPPGWTESEFGIASRAVASPEETSSMMGALAAERALARAGWPRDGFDVLIGACGVMEQPIPSTSVLIQDRLGLGASGIPTFDVNLTCLSFLTALDVAAMGMAAGRWRRALIVSSDIPSAGLDRMTPHASAIFGDGAAAVAVEAGGGGAGGRGGGGALLAGRFETYGQGRDLASLEAGGTRLRAEGDLDALVAGARFRMNPVGLFRAVARVLPRLVDRVLADAGLDRDAIDLVVCHQASAPGLEHVRRLFPGRPGRVVDVFSTTGNQIAASLPTALAQALDDGRARSGQHVLLLGAAAGISLGALALRL